MPDPAIDVIGKDAAAYPDLVGGQARTTRSGNGLFEVGHQADERPTEPVNGIAAGTKHWITDQADGTLGHCAILPQQLTTSSRLRHRTARKYSNVRAQPPAATTGTTLNWLGRLPKA